MSDFEERKKLIELIRQLAKEVAYEVLDIHLEEDHKPKNPLEEEIENIE
jgi:hypothetical protein